jgi:VWFA-related protein
MRTAKRDKIEARLLHAGILILAFLCIDSIAAAVQTSKTEAAGDSEKTSLYVAVEDGQNLITGLTEENFRLYVDGQQHSFELAPAEKPAAIALLIEHSRSSWIYYPDILRSMDAFLDVSEQGHWYALATFNMEMEIQVDFTKKRGKIISAFSDLVQPEWDEINTYDALYSILDKLGRQKHRAILIFIGSGLDTFSEYTLEDVRKKAESVNVVIYSMAAGSSLRGEYSPYLSDTDRLDLLQAESFMRMLADKSGGQAWFPKLDNAYRDVMLGIMQTIKSRYRLVYTSEPLQNQKFRKIQVKAAGRLKGEMREFSVRVREGFRAPYYR